MEYQTLYRQWRPARFADIYGQDAIVTTLKRQIELGRVAHAYLFCGSHGTGKTTMAKVFAKAINCTDSSSPEPCGMCEVCRALESESAMDISEIDAASNNSVDEIRELREKVKYPPTVAKYKVYIIDEVHMLSTGAFNALLKTLEEPPSHAVFILATTEQQRLPATILSRCQKFDFRRISVDTIVERMMIVLGGIGRDAEDNALTEIARASDGAMRDALSILDVCLSYTDDIITEDLVKDVLGSSGRDFMFKFVDSLIDNDAKTALTLINEAMLTGRDPQIFARDVAAHARNAMLGKIVGADLSRLAEITEEDAQEFITQAKKSPEGKLSRIMDLFIKAEPDMKWASQPRNILELCAVRACHPELEENSSIDERLAKLEKAVESGGIAVKAPERKPAPAKKEEPVKPKPKEAPKVSAAPPDEYLKAVEKIITDNPARKAAFSEMRFVSIDGDVVNVEFDKKYVMFLKLMERSVESINSAFSDVFGRPMKISMKIEGTPKQEKKAVSPAKSVIEQSYEVFGRENIELTE